MVLGQRVEERELFLLVKKLSSQCIFVFLSPLDKEARSSKVGVMEAQLSLPEVVNLNVTHAMVSAARIKAMALSEVTKRLLMNLLFVGF